MTGFVKKYILLLKQDFALFALLSLPGMIFYFIGLYQLEALSGLTLTLGVLNKFAVEFLTITLLFCLIHVLGFKKRWFFALVFFLYYITITADIVLLAYFKERFGLKYVLTLEGGQYNFMLDIRLLLYFAFIYCLPYFAIRRFWHRSSRHASAKKIAVAAVLLLVLGMFSPLRYIKSTDSFYASLLMNTTLAEITSDLIAKKYEYKEYSEIPPALQAQAAQYGLFKPIKSKPAKTYKRIILLTTEAFSNKFINSFNPEIPPAASNNFDNLVRTMPYNSLKYSALSTLYGLSVIFSGHPNAELMYKNDFPFSFVKTLRDNGWRTAFIRGADEEYMGEHIIFQSAGFDEVYGAKYFEQQPQYSNYVSWWGLTDRKLFEYAVDYLKKHRDENVFINLLTVDTHVPSGRADYLGQDYPAIDDKGISRKVRKIYSRTNMARAFARHNYDLGLFIEALKNEELLDDDTLLIITSDHPFFANVDTGHLFKNYRPIFDDIPLIFVSAQRMHTYGLVLSPEIFKSQQDIAPTILALAGFETPRGMFGRSVFETSDRTVFYMKSSYVVINNTRGTRIVPLNSKKPEDKALLQLLNSVVK